MAASRKVKVHKDIDPKDNTAALSNPFSTGGGGVRFECKVQATFLLTLLVEDFSPILNSKVTCIDFQSKRLGYDIDDLTVISSWDGVESKLLCQIKRGISLTFTPVFKEVIAAAWSDFNKNFFDKNNDFIVLITAQTPKTDVIRFIHDQARHAIDESDFIKRIYERNYSNQDNRKKLTVIKDCLKTANNGVPVSDKELWEFCKVFTILVFDMDYESSVNEYLIRALVASNTETGLKHVWDQLIVKAMDYNTAAAHVTYDKLPDNIKEAFSSNRVLVATPFNYPKFSYTDIWPKLALVGAWDEKREHDCKLVSKYIGKSYKEIQKELRQNLNEKSPIVNYSNGIWRVNNRISLIVSSSKLYFEDDIQELFDLAIPVYCDKDKRIQADGSVSLFVMSGNNYDYSDTIRDSLIEGLAIVSNKILNSCSCSKDVINDAANSFVKEVLADRKVSTWISLDTFLRTLAEVSPSRYLFELETTIHDVPEVIEALFPKKNTNLLMSRSTIPSVLWSIETLAWSEDYFNKCIRILGSLANLKYDTTNSANTPIHTIVQIMLPWYPQTLASIEKQKNAIKCLQTDYPEIAWEIIKCLLPGSTTSTTGAVKPKHIVIDIPDKPSVTQEQISDIQGYYSQLAIELAKDDTDKLHDLLGYFDHMGVDSIISYLNHIIETGYSWTDDIKYPVWSKLTIKKNWLLHQYEDLNSELLSLMEHAIESTKPKDIMYLYRLTYESNYFEYDDSDDPSPSRALKMDLQEKQIFELYSTYGINRVIEFAESINNVRWVAINLGRTISLTDISELINKLHNNEINESFFGYLFNSYVHKNGVDNIKKLTLNVYDCQFNALLLIHIEPSMELFHIAEELLGDAIGMYWDKFPIPYLGLREHIDTKYVWDNLLNRNRIVAAINIFNPYDSDASNIPTKQIEDTLLKAAVCEGNEELTHESVEFLIKELQSRGDLNIDTLCNIELIYLLWLDENSTTKPITLRYKLSNAPEYFCSMISLMYKKKSSDKHDHDISKPMADRLFEIFFKYDVIPGTDWDGHYDEEKFHNWIKYCKEWAKREDRWEVVMQTIGNGLSYATKNDDGLIDDFIMKELDRVDNEEMRRGYYLGIFNQRGVTWYDPEGKPEYKLADHYNELADKAEARGYSRYSETLRFISKSYIKEAEHHIEMHKKEQFMDE